MIGPNRLFVYGTLRAESPHPMARRLRAQALHVGKGTAPGRLYDMGAYPAAVFDSDERRRIVGDVFALRPDGPLLAALDEYEGTDPLYRRLVLEVRLATGAKVEAWAYGVREAPKTRLIPTGDFILHLRSRGARPVRP